MRIVNLTQHQATPEQRDAGVFEPVGKKAVQSLLTFDRMLTPDKIKTRANALTCLAQFEMAEAAMIGGAPYLMGPLEQSLRRYGITPLYSFSRRESEEQVLPDGSTKKVAIFRHVAFIEGTIS